MHNVPLSDGCRMMLRKLLHQRRIGGKHMPEILALKSIQYLPKQEYKDAIKDWEDCIKEGLIIVKQKPNERHVSINPRRYKEAAFLAGEE